MRFEPAIRQEGEVNVKRVLKWASLLIAVIVVGGFLWAIDFITLQGEWTIYTVECRQGTWNGDQCTGKLTAANPYRFRALKRRGEVLFWAVGSTEPSGRLAPCLIENRSNWTCKAGADSPRSITLAMVKGQPVADAAANTRPYHAVSKLKWMLLRYGNADQ
jgi:hypothetical protein